MTTRPASAAATTRRQRMADRMTEAQFQQQVKDLAQLTGWKYFHVYDSRNSPEGFPDVVITHPRQKRTIFAELKTQTGRLTDEQRSWLASLAEAGQETAVWRPADLDAIKAILLGRRIPTTHPEEGR